MAYRRTPAVEARLHATRGAIVRAARHRIAEVGLRGLGVAAVAADAGVSVGTLYRYFPSKDELLVEVVDEVCEHERTAVAKAGSDHDDPADRLAAATRCFAERAVASGRVAYAVIAEPAPPSIETHRLEHRRALAAVFAAIVRDGVAAGRFPAQDPDITATAIVGAVSEVLVGPLAPTGRPRTDDHTGVAVVLDRTLELVDRCVGVAR